MNYHNDHALMRNSITKAMDDGLKKGLAIGEEKGKKQAVLAIAKQLLAILDDSTIAAKTGLTEAEVAQLR